MKALATCLAILVACPALAEDGDAARGEKIFRKCMACHQIGEGAKHRSGPALNKIVRAPIASQNGFSYSNALRLLGEANAIWTKDTLDAFLTKPRDFAKGTRMTFRGLSKASERADVIAYLATFSGAVTESFAVAPEILAIEGDPEFGEYLAAECTSCHQTTGEDAGIPSITGRTLDDFVTAMHAYKAKVRENPVMQVITNRLSNDEIAALAAYFKDLQ